MEYRVEEWKEGFTPAALDEVARLWNGNAVGRHAFYPWTGELLRDQLCVDGKPAGKLLVARADDDLLLGFIHANQVLEDGYPWAGVVEMILVDAAFRCKGVGSALLNGALAVISGFQPRPEFVDALGAWPFGFSFNVLADGSERSGVFFSEPETYRLFRRAGFQPVRKSIVMRAELSHTVGRELPRGSGFFIGKRTERTWLDRVFRGRELWDHDLSRWDGRMLSRAIFGFMEGESRHEGRAIFSLFGVNTPRDLQRKGYAGVNISHLMNHVRDLGGEVMELHVYADNEPALALYGALGFKPVGETVMMHRLLERI